jgi:hypothetical protein
MQGFGPAYFSPPNFAIMAYIPDEAIKRQYSELTPAAVALYGYYCMKRNKKTGGFNCPERLVLSELKGLDRRDYYRSKAELIRKKWIEVSRSSVRPLVGFVSDINDTNSKPKSDNNVTPKNSKSDNNDTKSDISVTLIYKEVPAILPAILPDSSETDSPAAKHSKNNGRKKATKPKSEKLPSEHKEGMEFLHTTIGPSPDGGAQGKALKWLLAEGYTLDELKFYLPIHVKAYETGGYRASYTTLAKDIAKLKRQFPMIVRNPEASAAADEYEAAMMEIKRSFNARYDARKAAERAANGN